MIIKGKVHWVKKTDGTGDDINTDYIISGRYKFKSEDIKELGTHIFEDIEPNFIKKISKDDVIVAGKNFGCGSSREQAPLALIGAGISCIIAQSYARIFYRNAFNNGLPLLECDTTVFNENDFLSVDLDSGIIENITKKTTISIYPIPATMQKLLKDGGLVNHFKKYGGFKL